MRRGGWMSVRIYCWVEGIVQVKTESGSVRGFEELMVVIV